MTRSFSKLGMSSDSSFGSSVYPRTPRTQRWAIRMMAAFASVTLGVPDPASAHRSPLTCTTNGSGASITFVAPAGATELLHGDEICFQVGIYNTCPGCCDVTLLDSELVLPDGSIVPITVDASVPFGDDFLCPGDARCATASTCTLPGEVGYKYIIAHGDEHGSTGVSCPPTPKAGTGELSAFIRSTSGTVHLAFHVGATLCKAIATSIAHACCEPCGGTCTNVFSGNTCPFPSVFTRDKSCEEVTCIALDCSQLDDQCNEGRCDPATGGCVQAPTNEGLICDDGLFCTCGEICVGGDCTPQSSGPICCDDGINCTNDPCDEATNVCGHVCKTPSITCPPDKVFECDAVGDFGNPTIEDDCSVIPMVQCTEESTPGKLPQERSIIRTCTVTNDCGNSAQCRQRIDIVDTTPPVVTCPPDCTLECGDVQCVPPECNDPSCECGGVASCEDNCSSCSVSVTCEIIPKGCVLGQVAGLTPPPKLTVVRTFSATDEAVAVTATGQGNVGSCVQHIELVDTTPPVLDAVLCPGTITLCAGSELSFTPPTCTDTCGTCDVICVRSDNQPLPGPPPNGPITVTCVSSDECGNESSCNINVELTESGECFKVIPTVSEWGLVVLTLLLLIGAKIFFGRRQVYAV